MVRMLIPIKEAAKMLGVTMTTLRRWDKAGKLKAVRSGDGGHRYYQKKELDLFVEDLSQIAWEWVLGREANKPDPDWYCQDSAVFQSKLEYLRVELNSMQEVATISSLIVAATGEIGNNSFDHNLGNWPDVRGIFFGHDLRRRKIILADRGVGILGSLRRVRPSLVTDVEALRVAFTEKITGRAPESRGNGLKLVRKIISENPLMLDFRTGDAGMFLQQGCKELEVNSTGQFFRGCLAIITF